ncbi:glycine cleavage system protein GcvH [Chitinophaga nivalis]|uniref:Glycine cleavage system H protein n=1 Tax=Chitinophaga nivalis TaxID=2991709 RepID=A0ABT3IGX2_9BACT|nr:glycine cleavage system protein GcvH [Chitinophaga nivalis]MCW3467094.1 glycine cleavage system protein GcvH [Chitinophaga nivalis]MCW3483215.1 glycine cleavage system protein GcvH [Chitinophaga nivalis]
MATPTNLRYSEDHVWVLLENGIATIGLTDHAQKQLGEIVFVELSEVGKVHARHEEIGTVESVKAVSELFIPVSGEVVERNEAATDDPELLNDDPYGEGWLVKIKLSDSKEVDALLDAAAYDKLCNAENE